MNGTRLGPPPPGRRRDLATWALRADADFTALDMAGWSLLIRQARQADVLARLACRLAQENLLHQVPAQPRAHLEALQLFARAQHDDVRRELRHVGVALAGTGIPTVLLKGAAYVHQQGPAALGRLFTDVDILLPRERLAEAEAQLLMHGWFSTHLSAYDQRYYRDWMHELPPLQHGRRQTTLDVHHNILPLTARLKPSGERLLAAAVPAADGFLCLAPPDQVLHSITHLLHNEDLSHGLRDLSDVDLMLRHYGGAAEFWTLLPERARALDLTRPLYYGLRSAQRILGTPVPEAVLREVASDAPVAILRPVMDALWWRALSAQHRTAAAPFTATALFLLYVRAHWLRMPPLRLIRHLSYKAWVAAQPKLYEPA